MDKKNVIIIAVILIVVVLFGYQKFFKETEMPFTLAEVVRGDITQEVSATGAVRQGEEINISFKNEGKIEKIYVRVGETVQNGTVLAKLDTSQLKIQLNEAQAGLDSYQAKLDKLLAGSSPEEIQVAETAVVNAQISLENARKNLEDVKAEAKEDINQAYEDALNVLDDSELKIYNSFNTADSIQRTYFTSNDQESIKVKENRDKIETALNRINPYLAQAKADSKDKDIDAALSEMKKALEDTYDALKIIRESCEEPLYRGTVSSTDKSSLDTHRGYINTALTSTVNSQQTISSTKITNTANINTAQANVSSTEGTSKAAENDLALLIAEPRQEDVNLYQAQVNQAKAQVQLLNEQIQETVLKSPTNGQITKINNQEGESVQSITKVISLIPIEPFQIEVDIPEADIGQIDLENPCRITLDAFPEKDFFGTIIEIEPAEIVISGVVYYKTKTTIDVRDVKVKSGMTANLIIITAEKEDVLIIPQRAVKEKDGKKIVRVPIDDENFKEIEVKTGIRGAEGIIEIISGLNEGDKVITFIKEK